MKFPHYCCIPIVYFFQIKLYLSDRTGEELCDIMKQNPGTYEKIHPKHREGIQSVVSSFNLVSQNIFKYPNIFRWYFLPGSSLRIPVCDSGSSIFYKLWKTKEKN